MTLQSSVEILDNLPPAMVMLAGVTIRENAVAGAIVGELRAHDPDDTELFFSLVDDAEGRFEIVNGHVVVAAGAKLDYETAQFHTIIIRVSDGHGGALEMASKIRVLNVVEPEPTPQVIEITGTSNNDFIHAGSQNHRIFAAGGNDTILSGSGNDTLDGGDGNDVVDGGRGDDTFIWTPGTGVYDVITDSSGNDTLRIDALPSDLAFKHLPGDGLLISRNGTTALEIQRYFKTGEGGGNIERIVFSDGTVWEINDVMQAATNDPDPENQAPSYVKLTGNSIEENAANTSAIGYFTSDDPDGDILTYSLVDDADGRFRLHDNMLIVNDGSKLDFETNPYHAIKVRVQDSHGLWIEKSFIIQVRDIKEGEPHPLPENHPPVDLTLVGDSVEENSAANTFIGRLVARDPDGGALTYTLVDNAGGRFRINGDALVVNEDAKLDYETNSSFHITVKVTDARGQSAKQIFTIKILDVKEGPGEPPPVNHAPVDLTLTGDAVLENSPETSAIGYFTARDPDGDLLTYKLVDDAGGRFRLHDNMLIVNDGSKLDYETNQFHQVILSVTDSHGLSTKKAFEIKVLDVNEGPIPIPTNHAPEILGITSDWVSEGVQNGFLVGWIKAHDPDGDAFSYDLKGDAEGRFALVNGALVVADASRFYFDTDQTYVVTVRITDMHGVSTERNFDIRAIADGDQDPTEDEGRVIVDGDGASTLIGGSGDDTISGGGGNDVLYGNHGDDILSGDLGRDILSGGEGKDSFVFSSKLGKQNVDVVKDYSVAHDTIQLSESIFKAIAREGMLTKDAFVIGTEAQDAEDRIIYQSKTGKLFYDADGNGDKAAIQFATITKGLKTLSNVDFFIV